LQASEKIFRSKLLENKHLYQFFQDKLLNCQPIDSRYLIKDI